MIKFKLKVIEKYEEVGNREAGRLFNIDKLNIRLWGKSKVNFKKCERRQHSNHYSNPMWPELEAQLKECK